MKKTIALLLALCMVLSGCTQGSTTVEKPAFSSTDQ